MNGIVVQRIFRRMQSTSLFNRVLIGNSVVIAVGAIGGTFLTRHLAMMGDLRLILLFATAGIALTLLVNYVLISSAMRPLRELRELVDMVRAGQPNPRLLELTAGDPVIAQLVQAINSMLSRLERRTQQLRALSERAINANEEERKRIARGLHDDTAQALSTLIITLERLASLVPEGPSELRSRLIEADQLAAKALEDLRKVVFDLRPTMLDDLGLVPAIRWYARANLEPHGLQVSFQIADAPIRLPAHLETLLFRIAQEAVTNVIRHAHATSVMIELTRSAECVCLAVTDNGIGFDVGETVSGALRKKRLGLLGIQERASLAGGEVTIESEPEKGSRLYVRVPLREGE